MTSLTAKGNPGQPGTIPVVIGNRWAVGGATTFNRGRDEDRQPVRTVIRRCSRTPQYMPSFLTANLRGGFVHKTDEMYAVLRDNDVDVACITETWLKQSVPSDVVNIAGYAMHRSDRKDGRRGGGVAVFVRHNVPCVRLAALESPSVETAGCCTDDRECRALCHTLSSAPCTTRRQLTTTL